MKPDIPAPDPVREGPAWVQAVKEHRSMMMEIGERNRARKAELDAEWDALPEIPRTIAQHQAYARKMFNTPAVEREG